MNYDETMSAIDEALDDDSWEWGGDAARWHPGLEHETALTGRRISITTDVGNDAISVRAEWHEPVDLSEYLQVIDQMVIQVAERTIVAYPQRMFIEGYVEPESFGMQMHEATEQWRSAVEPPRLTGREPDVMIFDETLHWTEANPAWEGIVEQIRLRAEQSDTRCVTITTAQ